jgi:archaellum component FlaC
MNPDEFPLDAAKTEESLGIQEASARSLVDEDTLSLIEKLGEAAVSKPTVSKPTNSDAEALSEVPFGEVAPGNLEQRIAELHQQEKALQQDIAQLQATKSELQKQITTTQGAIASLMQEGLKELEQRKRDLQVAVEQLERRQERIRAEMRTTFAGVSQDLAIRVQSFKEYLVGSLQDLAFTADQLELTRSLKEPEKPAPIPVAATPKTATPKFAEESFHAQTKQIRTLLDQYRNRPDYYGPPWQLRRTFEPVHAERVSNWFFTQGGRGALRTMGSRLQNILITSAIISVLQELYGDRQATLILADSPERLGEWRRGLQDCLGITRSDFGPDRGAALFEDPFVLSQKADRMVKDGLLPLVVIDETEEQIDLTLLQYPLWLAFAPNPQAPSYSNY